MAPYLPQDRVAPSPYSEGGALYALGLIHANHGQDIRHFILECLRDTAEEVLLPASCPLQQVIFVGKMRNDWRIFEQMTMLSILSSWDSLE